MSARIDTGRALIVAGLLAVLGILAAAMLRQLFLGAAQPAVLAPQAQESATAKWPGSLARHGKRSGITPSGSLVSPDLPLTDVTSEGDDL